MLGGVFQPIQDELDNLIDGILAGWGVQHNPDGTHRDVTADTLEVGTIALTGGQIRFPVDQQPSSNNWTLDDYQRGTWTPVIGGSGGTSGQAYTTQIGRYEKIGRTVRASFAVVLSTEGTITTDVEIQGLPFTVVTTAVNVHVSALRWASTATNWVSVCATPRSGTTAALVTGAAAAAASNGTALTAADINNTTEFSGTLIYEAAQ